MSIPDAARALSLTEGETLYLVAMRYFGGGMDDGVWFVHVRSVDRELQRRRDGLPAPIIVRHSARPCF